ncbi:sulfotransferase [uncultured Croceicoccus sp.]|uniref:sulfotransferase family protein n=1 Tax=uncultured Croceicoccus sp. TaxID=1295329 RepID=UPI0026186F27|nr:sulfotransferase [uncultured Croceicoccus sp.]
MTVTPRPHRYAFVAGLHRTGTSMTARLIAAHPQVAAITNAPVPEKEGCYLQGAIPHDATHGIPGHFATDPAQHLIEGCRYDTLATRDRIEADWARWFDTAGPWRVEKSPVNLTRMRLYQQVFPTAQFIVLLRHPAAMAGALAKWSDRPFAELVDYALDAYDIVARDLARLHWAMVVRYEDLVARPDAWTAALHRFLDLEPVPVDMAVRDGNADYADVPDMTLDQAARAAEWGYGDGLSALPMTPVVRHPLRAVREDVLTLVQG